MKKFLTASLGVAALVWAFARRGSQTNPWEQTSDSV